jgi:hypothetical protein
MAAPESTAVAETAVVPASGAPAHRSRTRSPRQVQPAVRALSTAGTATPERELALLRKAQEALNRTPSEARVYLEEHARDYPSGTFEQEREMLFIELAVTQGERNHARWLARRFLTRFPGTTYQRHLETLLADDPTQLEQETKPATHTQSMDPNGGDQHATGSSH